jgi:hypothetical protein
MTPPQGSAPRPRPRAASPAERSAEFLETQRRLKEEAAERRSQAADANPKRSSTPRPRAAG